MNKKIYRIIKPFFWKIETLIIPSLKGNFLKNLVIWSNVYNSYERKSYEHGVAKLGSEGTLGE